MTRSPDWSREPPIGNARIDQLAAALRDSAELVLGRRCPVNPGYAHVPLRGESGAWPVHRCMDRSLGLAVLAAQSEVHRPCGWRSIRLDIRFSSLVPISSRDVVDPSSFGVVSVTDAAIDMPHGTRTAANGLVRVLGPVTMTRVTPGDPTYRERFALQLTWLAARFPGTALAGDLGSQIVADSSALDVFVLEAGDVPVAAALCAVDTIAGTMCYYSPSFDELYSRYSPGSFLLYSLLDWCAGNGIAYLDLGSMRHQYKHRLATETFCIGYKPPSDSSVLERAFTRTRG